MLLSKNSFFLNIVANIKETSSNKEPLKFTNFTSISKNFLSSVVSDSDKSTLKNDTSKSTSSSNNTLNTNNYNSIKPKRTADQTGKLFYELKEIFPEYGKEIHEILNEYPTQLDLQYLTNMLIEYTNKINYFY